MRKLKVNTKLTIRKVNRLDNTDKFGLTFGLVFMLPAVTILLISSRGGILLEGVVVSPLFVDNCELVGVNDTLQRGVWLQCARLREPAPGAGCRRKYPDRGH